MWSTIEVNVGLMCACMPALRGLLAHFLPGVFAGWGSGSGSGARRTGQYIVQRSVDGHDTTRNTIHIQLETKPENTWSAVGGPRRMHESSFKESDGDSDGRRTDDTTDFYGEIPGGKTSDSGITYSRSFAVEFETDRDEAALMRRSPVPAVAAIPMPETPGASLQQQWQRQTNRSPV